MMIKAIKRIKLHAEFKKTRKEFDKAIELCKSTDPSDNETWKLHAHDAAVLCKRMLEIQIELAN